MRFRIYYADGSSFGSDQGSWEEAPSDGVLIVAIKKADGTVQYNFGSDHYGHIPHSDTYVSLQDLGAFLRAYVPQIKYGVWVSDEVMESTRDRALSEFGEPTVNNPYDG